MALRALSGFPTLLMSPSRRTTSNNTSDAVSASTLQIISASGQPLSKSVLTMTKRGVGGFGSNRLGT